MNHPHQIHIAPGRHIQLPSGCLAFMCTLFVLHYVKPLDVGPVDGIRYLLKTLSINLSCLSAL